MEYVKYCTYIGKSVLHNNKHIANGGHISRNSKQQPFTVVESFVNPCIQVIKIHVCAWERITMGLFTAD